MGGPLYTRHSRGVTLTADGLELRSRSMVRPGIADGHLGSLGLEANDITLGHPIVSAPVQMLPSTVREVLQHLGRESVAANT